MLALVLLWGGRGVVALSCTLLRDSLVREAVETGQSTLILPSDRYQMVSWHFRDPADGETAYHFRNFYGLPQDTTLIFLPPGSFEHWPDIPPELWEARTEFLPNQEFAPSLP